ncbi:Hypothetical protein PP7435_CHR2-1266 [Komagataella phaffii CBS 7435]|uniref:ERCC4 domain-containing protein n=2 Tax=Komagataella phaffii TaxID=460519 RepID=C4QZG7_KOMPG|nr:Hypothetical protein PAS_chr2-1_0041 [Komagataella phaffii GS115]AOA62084.1 GQ67_00066T0 [Komagataella phaffii]CAH2448864.1 Hypothetical protein BQ9382_C2-6815 [Komagataella phaffii CBS 7435]AOA67532.1 GQ68_01321T0 [Komagataella phaffii GS115]CAY68641.1 Hypothetical protein PAS_chr2-1_0041 [Komagataella phaffii GS115]CCA38941.1 Hypothetical protein PP7435_CHR2-1266 [Komagataella phaffii CBS 7435]
MSLNCGDSDSEVDSFPSSESEFNVLGTNLLVSRRQNNSKTTECSSLSPDFSNKHAAGQSTPKSEIFVDEGSSLILLDNDHLTDRVIEILDSSIMDLEDDNGSPLDRSSSQEENNQVELSLDEIITSSQFTQEGTNAKEEEPKSYLQQLLERATPQELRRVNKVTRTQEEMLSKVKIEISNSFLEHIKRKATFEFDSVQIEELDSKHKEIRWKYELDCLYYPEQEIVVPLPQGKIEIVNESTILLSYTAEEMATNLLNESLISLINEYPADSFFIILVEGWDTYLRSIKTKHNRDFVKEIRMRLDQEELHQKRLKSTPRPSKPNPVDPDKLWEKVLCMELEFKVNIFPVHNVVDSLEWIKSFTSTLASRTFNKKHRNTGFERVGTVRSGSNGADCYFQALQQLKYMTPITAKKLMNEYPSINRLYDHISRHNHLEGCSKSIREALIKLFTCDNPNELIN